MVRKPLGFDNKLLEDFCWSGINFLTFISQVLAIFLGKLAILKFFEFFVLTGLNGYVMRHNRSNVIAAIGVGNLTTYSPIVFENISLAPFRTRAVT